MRAGFTAVGWVVVSLVAVLLGGCGGGGASGDVSSAATPVGTVVSMATINGVMIGSTTGATLNFPALTGTDSQGHAYSGSMQVIADGVLNFEGQNVTRSRTLITMQSGGVSASSSSSQYSLLSDGSLYKAVESSGLVYVPTSQTTFPDSVKVGDSGTMGTFSCSDGTTVTETWSLLAGVDGSSHLAVSSATKTGTTVTETEVDTYHLDRSGVPTGISVTVISSGGTVNLSGSKS